MGSFFWGYICTELPGGRLAEIIGPKRVFGHSMLVSSAVTFLTPWLATYGYIAVAMLRTVIGFMLVGFPCNNWGVHNKSDLCLISIRLHHNS